MKHFIMKLLLSLVVFIFIASCSSSSSKSNDEVSYEEFDIGIPINNVSLPAEETTTFTIPVTSGIQRGLTDLSLDLEETLKSFTFSQPAPKGNRLALAPVTTTLTARISTDSSTVCTEGEKYGPFIVVIDDNDEVNSVTPKKVEASKPTLNIVNTGWYSICFEVYTPSAITFSGSKYQVAVENCQSDPLNIGGYWSGTYSCDNTGSAADCVDATNVPIEILIVQDPDNLYNATYGDYQANYTGVVCGETFEYDGGYDGYYDSNLNQMVGGYSEEGVMTFQDESNATKESSFVGNEGYDCRGTCTDLLSKGLLRFGIN